MGVVALSSVECAKLAFRPPEGSVPWHGDASSSSWNEPTWKVNYFVPQFGMDTDVQSSLDNVSATEDKLKHQLAATFKDPGSHPVNYFVPNFGLDSNVLDTQ